MDSLTIRETFLRFYEARDHRRFDSASLIPQDPTVLLTIAGMLPFKPYFLGEAAPPAPRATSHQKCARTNDIENVGHTTRHLTFFEMLGNFSFGDYFKGDAIRWAWELSVDAYGLDPERIWVTVHEDDDEAYDLVLANTSCPPERIQRLGEDNLWAAGAPGPCGYCAELHYDRGPEYGQEGGPAVDGERYLEFYNLVFMQFLQDAEERIVGDLPQQNVDTGMGLERMAILQQGVADVFETDILRPMVDRAAALTGVTYRGFGASGTPDGPDHDVSLRVIAEHARTAAFLITDGVLPSKEGRGYVLRRLLRRAIRHGHLLGMDVGRDDQLLVPMIDTVIATMGEAYPDLVAQRELITRIVQSEEADFGTRIRQGLARVDQVLARVEPGGAFPGDVAFELHDTFGFPIDLTVEIAEDTGLSLDRDRFEVLMDEQRDRARAGAKKGGGGIPVELYREVAGSVGTTEFLGYRALAAEAELGAIVTPGGIAHAATEGDEVDIVLARTPFYAEGGGQVGDQGLLTTATGRLQVLDTQEAIQGLIVHRARVVAGEVSAGQPVEAVVDPDRRLATARSHSATHVLHATVKEVLGQHAQQAGSLVQPGRLRFDFPHFESVSRDRLQELEATINERVLRDPHVQTEVMSLGDAKAAGAVANFGDKYGEVVRVVTIGEFSKELCGGTHVPTGATIGTITIVREESIGSNTRRVEALTGMDAFRHLAHERLVAEEVARLVDVPVGGAVERVRGLLERVKGAEKELAKVRSANLATEAVALADAVEREDGLAVVVTRVDGVAGDDLRTLANEIRGRLATRGIVVLGARSDDGKAQLICTVTADLADAGVEARPILHPAAQVVGGGAGGRGDLAQAGGKLGDHLDEALEVAAQGARDAARDVRP